VKMVSESGHETDGGVTTRGVGNDGWTPIAFRSGRIGMSLCVLTVGLMGLVYAGGFPLGVCHFRASDRSIAIGRPERHAVAMRH